MNATVAPAGEAGAANGLADWIAPARTALVVIDMQVDFASPEGVLGGFGVDLSSVKPAAGGGRALGGGGSSAGVDGRSSWACRPAPSMDSAAWRERMRRPGGDPEQDSALCRGRHAGRGLRRPEPLAGELVIAKTAL